MFGTGTWNRLVLVLRVVLNLSLCAVVCLIHLVKAKTSSPPSKAFSGLLVWLLMRLQLPRPPHLLAFVQN